MIKYIFTLLMMISSYSYADLSYNHIGLGQHYYNIGTAGQTIDGTGTNVDGSYLIIDQLALVGSASTTQYKDQSTLIDVDEMSLGLLGYLPINQHTHFMASVSRSKSDIEGGTIGILGGEGKKWSTNVMYGIRHNPLKQFEVELKGIRIAGKDLRINKTSTTVRYYSSDGNVSVGLSYEFSPKVETVNLSSRLHF